MALSTTISAISQESIDSLVAANFDLVSNTLVQKAAPDPLSDIFVEVGDSKQPEFYAQVKLKWASNDCNCSFRFVDLDAKTPTFSTSGAVIQYVKPAYEIHYLRDEHGFVERLILNSKPASNRLQWTINYKNLDFWFQPALDAEAVADELGLAAGDLPDDRWKNPAWISKYYDRANTKAGYTATTGPSWVRPIEIVDGYVAMHPTKKNSIIGGINYAVGVAFDLYQTRATDANGQSILTVLTLDLTNNILYRDIPIDFWNNATYPMVIE